MPNYVNETLLPIIESELDELIVIPPLKNNKIAIVFDNFLRDKLMLNLVKSIFYYTPGVKLYISDQSVFNPITDKFYNKLREAGHKIIYCGFDCGISVARNRALEAVEEPYIFLSDCDLLFTANTNLNRMIEILDGNKKLGFLSLYEYKQNKLSPYEVNLSRENDTLTYTFIDNDDEIRKQDFFYCDYGPNAGMLKKALIKTVKYEESMKLAEHLDFFMQIKYKSKWKVAIATKISLENQNINIKSDVYDSFRGRNKLYWNLYHKKWGLTLINGYNVLTNSYISPPKLIETIEPIIEKKINASIVDPISNYKLFFAWLNSNGIQVCLLKDTCFLAIIKKEYNINCLQLGIKEENLNRVKKYLEENNIKAELIIYKFDKVKLYQFNDINAYVPKPVVLYLENYMHKTWGELISGS